MKKLSLIAATLLALACTKEEAAAPAPKAKPTPGAAPSAPSQQAAPAKPAAAEMTITSKSPDAALAFKKGREAQDNFRQADAAEQYKKALELDPGFALAQAHLGQLTPGAEGLHHIEAAAKNAASLPEGERTTIELILANRQGDLEKVRALTKKAAELLPGDWHAQLAESFVAAGLGKWDDSVAAAKKAADANPKLAEPYNQMAYGYIWLGKFDDAIAAAKKQVELKPGEPNPVDTLAEVTAMAGKLDDAEAGYKKALEMTPKFPFALSGVATVRALKGDWAGATEAINKLKSESTRPVDVIGAEGWLPWLSYAQGKTDEAFKALDAQEKDAEAAKLPERLPGLEMDRATILVETGKADEALKHLDKALEKAQKAELPPGGMAFTELNIGIVRLWALQKKPADAEKALAAVEDAVKKAPNSGLSFIQSGLHHARGLAALAKGDGKAAAAEMAQCEAPDYLCRRDLADAQEKAGDKAAAEATRKALKAMNFRDPQYLAVWAKLK